MMTIEKYINEVDEVFDIFDVDTLEFAEPDNSREAEENLLWVLGESWGLKKLDVLQMLSVVVKSYYNGTIEWERY